MKIKTNNHSNYLKLNRKQEIPDGDQTKWIKIMETNHKTIWIV